MVVLLLPLRLFAQGSLTPPGAPATTMKTLQQIEPRIDLQNAPASAVDTTSATSHYVINQPGSYYLSDNIAVTKTNGIQTTVEGVTLDLNGFRISRGSGSGGVGIDILATSPHATVRNGSISGFSYGINANGRNASFQELTVSSCTSSGMNLSFGALILSCSAHDNSGSYAIAAGSGSAIRDCAVYANTVTNALVSGNGSVVTNCAVYGNTSQFSLKAGYGSALINCSATANVGQYAIYADWGSALSNCAAFQNTSQYGIYAARATLIACSAYGNTSSSATSAGIATDWGSTVSHCTATFNTSTAGSATTTTGIGFQLGSSSTIQNCTACLNKGDGIRLAGDDSARGNTSEQNGVSGDGAGIHAVGSGSRIDDNLVGQNTRGIHAGTGGNIITRNTARTNATNYVLATNNVFGAIVDRTVPASAAVSGNSAASSAATTDPWANFSY